METAGPEMATVETAGPEMAELVLPGPGPLEALLVGLGQLGLPLEELGHLGPPLVELGQPVGKTGGAAGVGDTAWPARATSSRSGPSWSRGGGTSGPFCRGCCRYKSWCWTAPQL